MSEKFKDHDSYIRIHIEEIKSFEEALAYISKLSPKESVFYLKKYGNIFVQNLPEETTSLMITLCKDELCKPQDFIHTFVSQSSWLVYFLESILSPSSDSIIWNTLLELLLSENQGEKALKILKNPSAKYDVDFILFQCQLYNVDECILYLYEKGDMLENMFSRYMDNNQFSELIEYCQKLDRVDFWYKALSYFSAKTVDCSCEIIKILESAGESLSPLTVIEILSRNSLTRISVIKNYVLKVVEREKTAIEEDLRLITSYNNDMVKLGKEIKEMESNTQIFQVTKCSTCKSPLDLPAMHFVCKHSYHLRCMGENEKECPLCALEYKTMFGTRNNQLEESSDNKKFFQKIKESNGDFSVVAEYFGKNIFIK